MKRNPLLLMGNAKEGADNDLMDLKLPEVQKHALVKKEITKDCFNS